MNLNESINFYPPWNYQKAYGFLMLSVVIEGNQFALVRIILEAKADELFECVWPFCGTDPSRVKDCTP